MLDAGNLWELLEARVAATPDGVMAIDQDGRALTFAEYRAEAERAAAGLARLGHRRGRRRLVAAADVARVAGAGRPRSPGSAPSRTRCSRSTASARSASSPARPAPSCSSSRARGGASTTRRWPPTSPGDQPGLEVLVADHALPAGRPVHAAAGPRRAGRPRRPPGALALLHVGHDGRPEGRAAHRRLDQAAADGHVRAARGRPRPTASAACSRSPTSPAPSTSSARSAIGCTMLVVEAFDAEATPPILARERRHPRRRRHAVPHGVPRLPAEPPRRGAAVPGRPAPTSAAARPSRRSCTTT